MHSTINIFLKQWNNSISVHKIPILRITLFYPKTMYKHISQYGIIKQAPQQPLYVTQSCSFMSILRMFSKLALNASVASETHLVTAADLWWLAQSVSRGPILPRQIMSFIFWRWNKLPSPENMRTFLSLSHLNV